MAQAEITKRADTPEGPVKFSGPGYNITVNDDKPYETNDATLIALVGTDNPFLEVKWTEGNDPKEVRAAAREDLRELDELQDAQEAADKQRAEKEALEAPAPKPSNVQELRKIQGDRS